MLFMTLRIVRVAKLAQIADRAQRQRIGEQIDHQIRIATTQTKAPTNGISRVATASSASPPMPGKGKDALDDDRPTEEKTGLSPVKATPAARRCGGHDRQGSPHGSPFARAVRM